MIEEAQRNREESAAGDTGGNSRRKVLSLGVQGGIFAVAAGVSALLRLREETKPPRIAEPLAPKTAEATLTPGGAPQNENWRTGEFTNNKIASFMQIFLHTDRKSVYFIDQNGNIVTGGPISIPPEILAQEKDPDFTQIFQRWLNDMRGELKRKYPTIFLDLSENREEPTLLSSRQNLDPNGNGEHFFDKVLENARKPVSRKNHMARFEFLKKELALSRLPKNIQGLFICATAVESQFVDKKENSSGAAGAFQIIRDQAKKHGLIGEKTEFSYKTVSRRIRSRNKWIVVRSKQRIPFKQPFDLRNDFELSAKAAIKILEAMHDELRRDENIGVIQQTYGVNEEDFLHLAIINSYQAGPTRIRRMCAWFRKNYPLSRVEKILGKGPYGPDLYTLMSSLYIHSGKDMFFGKQSRDYTIRGMAMRELFAYNAEGRQPQFSTTYRPPAPDHEEESTLAILENGHAQTAVIGLAAGAAAFTAGRLVQRTTRRGLLRPLAGALAFGIGSSYAGRMLPKVERRLTHGEEPVSVNPFSPFILAEEEVQDALLNTLPPLNIQPQTVEEIRALKDKIDIGLDVAKKFKLPRFETDEDIRNTAGVAQVPEKSSPNFRLRGVGMLDDGKIENDERYTYCYPHTEAVIREIDERLNEKLSEYGFPPRFKVRLIVQGLARSAVFQEALRQRNQYAAREDSPHMFGHTFDIQRNRYDIIDTEDSGRKFCMTSVATTDPVNNELGLVSKINAALGRLLIEMKREGKVTVIHEGANPVYHISDMKPLG